MGGSEFTDCEKRTWKLSLTMGSVNAVKRETGVNLALASKTADWVDVLFGDPERIVSVLWVLCEPQAKEAGVDAESFGYGFDGPTLEAAGMALAAAIADFFPRSRIAQAIREGLPKVMDAADQRAVEAIQRNISTVYSSGTNSREPLG